MSMKDKVFRGVRANLNELLDRIRELDLEVEEGAPGFEYIGRGAPGHVVKPRPESEKTLRDYYANLEVEYGADMDTVKASYRRLMRKYHPDKYSSEPRMEELSTELTQELTRAYRAIESYWESGRY
ncbi:MAG: DnaJ domain-containing protein [Myxococcota bacterium]